MADSCSLDLPEIALGKLAVNERNAACTQPQNAAGLRFKN